MAWVNAHLEDHAFENLKKSPPPQSNWIYGIQIQTLILWEPRRITFSRGKLLCSNQIKDMGAPRD